MKFSLIICALSIFCGLVETNGLTKESATKSNTLRKSNIVTRGPSQISLPSESHNSTSRNLAAKIRRMPKIQIKNKSPQNGAPTLVLTTRRPLMKKIKFTLKPHAVHYIQPQTSDKQVNFSKRNSNVMNRHQTQHKNINYQNITHTDIGEDRFRNFTDVNDIDELDQSKRKISSRRRYSLQAAGSANFKSIAHYTVPNADVFRSKAKLAKKNVDLAPPQQILNIQSPVLSCSRNVEANNTNTVKSTNESVHFTTTIENSVPLTNITEKPFQCTTVTEYVPSETIPVKLANSETKIQNSDEKYEPNNLMNIRKYNTATTVVTPAANGNELISIESNVHNTKRHKRRINIIEEERVATTSTRLKFNGHEKPFGADSTYRNIHT